MEEPNSFPISSKAIASRHTDTGKTAFVLYPPLEIILWVISLVTVCIGAYLAFLGPY